MVHDLSPFIFKISDNFGPRWYGFSYMLGFVCAYFMISWLVERQRSGLQRDMVADFVTYAAFGTLIGGRLGYCLFYDPTLFWSFSGTIPFWKVLAVHEGGMASHGGIIGIVGACWLFARKHGLNFVYLLDVAAIVGPIGVIFGRIANFINGELVGRVAPPEFPYGVRFPTDIHAWPTYEFERLSTLTPVVEKLGIESSRWSEVVSQFKLNDAARNQVYTVLNRIVNEIQGGNAELKAAIAPLLDYRYPSQLIAMATEGVFTILLLFFLARKSHRPGWIAGSFIICYAGVRIFNEQFRLPDLQLGYEALGLSRGQWISIGMLAVGVIVSLYWARTQSSTIHGWSRGEDVKIGSRRSRR